MLSRTVALLSAVVVLTATINAKDKKKQVLPNYVLEAHTVAVIGDPSENISLTNPNDQRRALNDVEQALSTWGRLTLTQNVQEADLVFMVRKGRTPGAVIAGDPNNRPVIYQPDTSGGARIGIYAGTSLSPTPVPAGTPGTEAGTSDDLLVVYRGHEQDPFDHSAVWRYSEHDALNPPTVRAVEEFRKAIDASEKAKNDPAKAKN